jgi:tetratricopeptide (TPR) repeat protein
MWHGHRGNMLKETNRIPEAEQHYHDALRLAKELAAAHRDRPLFQQDLAIAYSGLGELLRLLGRRFPEAKAAHEEAVKRVDVLVAKHSGVAVYRETQADCRYHLALLLQTAGYPKEAEKVYRQVLDPFEKKEPGLPFTYALYRDRVAASYSNLAAIWAQANRPQDAEKAWNQALAILEGLAKESPKNARYHYALGCTLHNLALRLRLKGKLTEARKLDEQAVSALGKAVQLDPLHPDYAPALRTAYLGLLNSLVELKDHGGLAKRAEEMANVFPKNPKDLFLAVACFVNAGTFAAQDKRLSQAKRTELARTYHDQAMKFLQLAVAVGFNDVARLNQGPIFEILRSRDDFMKLLKDLEAKKQAGNK